MFSLALTDSNKKPLCMTVDKLRRTLGALSLGAIAFAGLCALTIVAARVIPFDGATVTAVTWPAQASAEFPLRISDDRRYLVDNANKPFLVRGDAAWSLIVQLKKEDAEVYLQERKKQGFNLLLINLIEHHFSDNPPRNAYGEAPFKQPGDFAQPNEAYFTHADWVLHRAAELGFAVLLCPAYLGYDGKQEGWYQEMRLNGVDALRSYGHFLGERYRDFKNIIWLEGGDYTPPAEGLALVNAVALAIRSAGAEQLQAAHWAPETSAMDVPNAGWLDLNTTYTYQPVYLKSLVDEQRSERKPHILLESVDEDEHASTPRSLRAQVYYALLTGAAGDVFGNRWIWKFKKKTLFGEFAGQWWRAALDTPGTRGVEHARALFSTRDWMNLRPDAKNHVLIAGAGEHGGDAYAVAAATPDGRLAIAYIPSQRSLTIDASSLALPARVRWYDPTDGSYRDARPDPLTSATTLHLETPPANHAGDADWVLLIEAN